MRVDLAETERRAFRAAVDTGLWDVMIAGVISLLAIGPLLSTRMGDFWATFVFLPFLAVLYGVLLLVQRRVIEPRVGVVRFGVERKERLKRLTGLMTVVYVASVILGLAAAFTFSRGASWAPPIMFALIVLLLFSLAAYFLDIPRYFAYGLLLMAAGGVGEILFRHGLASHYGYPLMFGISAVLIAGTGLLRLARHLPPAAHADEPPVESRHDD